MAVLAGLIAGCDQAQTAPRMSPIVTWDPEIVFGGVGRTPTTRPLAAGEVATAQQRAGQFFEVLKAVPAFSQPSTTATELTSWAVVNECRLVEQQFIAYASNPRDVRRRADGALWGVMGGVHGSAGPAPAAAVATTLYRIALAPQPRQPRAVGGTGVAGVATAGLIPRRAQGRDGSA